MTLVVLPINEEKSQAMAAYMKHRFVFLGIQAPERKKLTKELVGASKTQPTTEVLRSIAAYYQLKEREYQYVAIDLAIANVNRFSSEEIKHLSGYVSQKAWWDSVDAWRKFFGLRIRRFPAELVEVFYLFQESDDFWMRRVAINLQLMQKEKTELSLLTIAIVRDQTTAEFFIQKAIGWSLRQYAKVDQEWVQTFLAEHDLSQLACREASKHFEVK